MQRIYSKPSGDIGQESLSIIEQEESLQKIVAQTAACLADYPVRTHCLLCRSPLAQAEIFNHRQTPFYDCGTCHHVQSVHQPDESYEQLVSKALGYEGIYPALDMDKYRQRCARVYQPKADWVFQALTAQGLRPQDLSWCDIGCGTGAFLYALQEAGCTRIKGVERDAHNRKLARAVLGDDIVMEHQGTIGDATRIVPADVYSAFFVFEHIPDMHAAIQAFRALPPGTHFAFSVPMFSFVTLLESLLPDHYPRNLDAMMHTQVYTDESIQYLLAQSGMEMVSEWVFGQDSIDLHRYLSINLKKFYPEKMYGRLRPKLAALVDPLQNAIDKAHFSDARHILAVRR